VKQTSFLGIVLAGAALAQSGELTPAQVHDLLASDLRGAAEMAARPPPMSAAPVDIAQSILATLPSPPREVYSGRAAEVSVASLLHKIPKDAVKAFQKASKLSESGDYKGAAKSLEKAVALDPAFPQAHANLGIQYMRLGQLREAEAELLRSLELDNSSSIVRSNLAAAQLQGGNLREAERNARLALDISGQNNRARFVLGMILVRAADTRTEGIQQLKWAARTIPAAEQALNQVREQ
jgi:Flp pilus assembly protein TadD